MDKKKFDAGFRALCIAVGFSINDEDETFTLNVYYRKLKEKGFTDNDWAKVVNRLIDTWRPEFGVKFPPVSQILDMSGMSVSSMSKKAHAHLKTQIMRVGGYEVLDLGIEHKHFVAMEAVRRMGGWFTVCQSGIQEFERNKSRFCEIFEELYYTEDVPKKPLLCGSDRVNQEYLANYNKNQIENKKD